MHFNPSPKASDEEFSVQVSHLIEAFSIKQIEAQERVDDPLGSVPDLAFGHLNKTWMAFLQKGKATDTIWSFEAHWKPRWGSTIHKKGYVFVDKKNQPGEFLLNLNQESWPDD